MKQTIGEAFEVLRDAFEDLLREVMAELRDEAAWLKRTIKSRLR